MTISVTQHLLVHLILELSIQYIHHIWNLELAYGTFHGICRKTESINPRNTLILSLLHVNISSGLHIKFTSKCSFVD